MSATPDSTLANPQQIIAELRRERDEALAQQIAVTEVLQVINSSPGDLASVFDALLDKALRLCDASYGTLLPWDGERLHRSIFRGASVELLEALRGSEPVMPRPGSVADRLLHGENVICTADIREDPSFAHSPRVQILGRVGGVRSYIAVSLRKDDRFLGFIAIYRREVRPFTDKQIALLQNFAAQAVIAMENARLLTETREALEQQTATAEVLGVINSSPGDLAPVFEAMLEKAMRLCDATFGLFCSYDSEFFRATAFCGVPPALAEFFRKPFRAGRGFATRQLVAGEPIVHIADITAIEPSPGIRATAELGGGRTVIWVALRKEETLLGFIAMYRREVRAFTDKQIALLQNFAGQAVIAMENARLLTETREALEQQTATAEVLQVINSSPGDLAPVFDVMLEKAIRLCGANFGGLTRVDGEDFHYVAMHNVPPAFAESMRQPRPIGPGVAHYRLLNGEEVVQVQDVTAEDIYRSGEPGRRALADLGGARTVLWAALRKDNTLLGAFVIYRKEVRPFTNKEIALLQNFAAQAVIAMENARLLGELRQRTEEVAELNRGLEARVAEQVDELGRVGRLKRFLAPQLAELIVSQGDEKILESHRREIVVVFCDLRGYTAFTETAEPEEVLDFLREYHGVLGPLVSQFEGTLDQFSGDGIMVFFNDPLPIPDPAERAVKMAMAMREAAGTLIAHWRERGRDLGFGAGIAQGYATLGQIGFSERSGYTAIGTVCNVAARLCAEAKDGQILLSQLVNVALKESVATEQLGPLALKGLTQPVVAYNVPLAAIQPALRVIEGGPQSV
jgi:class 3 adenylate cyclase